MSDGRRVSTDYLAALCRRAGTRLDVGLDVRSLVHSEIESGPAWLRPRWRAVGRLLDDGASLADALNAARPAFPELFHALVEVGEHSGRLGEAFHRLADHYDQQGRLRREFLARMTLPWIQLATALLVVGIVILLNGWLRSLPGNESLDMLGLGLVGLQGLVGYLVFLAAIVSLGAWLIHSVRRGAAWVRPLENMALSIPLVGNCLMMLALSRVAWSLQLTLESGVELKRGMDLALCASGLSLFQNVAADVRRGIERNQEIQESMAATGVFPQEFLLAVAAGETSGRLPESLARLSRSYDERARASLAMIAQIVAYLLWLIIAAWIITIIFRLFQTYLGTIQGLL